MQKHQAKIYLVKFDKERWNLNKMFLKPPHKLDEEAGIQKCMPQNTFEKLDGKRGIQQKSGQKVPSWMDRKLEKGVKVRWPAKFCQVASRARGLNTFSAKQNTRFARDV